MSGAPQEFQLVAESELRFEIEAPDTKVTVEVRYTKLIKKIKLLKYEMGNLSFVCI